MPLYEYQCDSCGQRFEVIQKFSDPAPEACRKCGKGPVRRLASSPAIQFKGTGWYITDYAKGNSGASAPGASKSDSESKSSDSKGGDGGKDSSSKDSSSKDSGGGSTESKSESKSDSTATPSSKPSSGS
jgi:putative FmdB family regulatory protein